MVKLCWKGADWVPTVRLPARMWMMLAVRLRLIESSTMIDPSMSRMLMGLGLISRRMVQLQLTVTLSPDWGRVLFGHWEVLLQRRTKLYLLLELQMA
jgi:hypothetical protein